MTAAVDALLTRAAEAQLPPPAERMRLRKAAGLTQREVAAALELKHRVTVAQYESGEREPQGERRTAYARLLRGLAAQFPPEERLTPSEELGGPPPASDESSASSTSRSAQSPAESQGPSASSASSPSRAPEPAATGASSGRGTRDGAGASGARGAARPAGSRAEGRRERRLPSQPKTPEAVEFLTHRVETALGEHDGDVEAATAALVHKAIPDVMELLETCRLGGRYDFSRHPSLPDLLWKKPGRDSDDIWEARPKWSLDARVLAPGEYRVTALDMNAAYLSALKTQLPIGALEHHLGPDEGGPAWDKRRSGIHRITPPAWEHPQMPHPLGNREEPGPLWVTEPTLRLLFRAADRAWCDRPLVHESWTSGSSEGLLEKMRDGLVQARRAALGSGDEVTVEYIKAMYAKFVSTAGESNFNREIYRPDWVHIIRSQAFANLWLKAEKAQRAGLQAVRMMGTDELHLVGDWRQVFTEGRDVAQVKIKDTYTLTVTSGERER